MLSGGLRGEYVLLLFQTSRATYIPWLMAIFKVIRIASLTLLLLPSIFLGPSLLPPSSTFKAHVIILGPSG